MTRGFITSGDYTQRQLRAIEVIRAALAEIFSKGSYLSADLFDISVTISNIKLSADLRHATVYIVPFGKSKQQEFIKALKQATPNIRKALTKKIGFKFSPEIVFRLDDSFDHAAKITSLVNNTPELL